MSKPRFYSISSLDILPEDRDLNGVYHLRTFDGFRIYRVSETPSRDWIPLVPYNKFKKVQKVTGSAVIGVALDEDADIVLMSSSSGSTIRLPSALENKGRVVTLMHFHSNLSNEYLITPGIRLRAGSVVEVYKLKGIGSSSPSEPLMIEAFSDGKHCYVLNSKH